MSRGGIDGFVNSGGVFTPVELSECRAGEHSGGRSYIREIAACSDHDVVWAEVAAVGGVAADCADLSSLVRHYQRLDPRVRCAFAKQVARDVPPRDTKRSQDGQHNVRIVLTNALAEVQRHRSRRLGTGDADFVRDG